MLRFHNIADGLCHMFSVLSPPPLFIRGGVEKAAGAVSFVPDVEGAAAAAAAGRPSQRREADTKCM